MRRRMLGGSLAVAACLLLGTDAAAQAPAPAPAPAQKQPARASASRGTATLTVTVTDGAGLPVQGAAVTVTGPLDRNGTTVANGSVRLLGLRAGTYRIRVEHEGFITLEREIVVRTAPVSVDLTLSPAAEPAEAPEPEPAAPPPAAAPDVPPGEPRSVMLADFIEKNFISSREPKREDEIGCTASARTTLLQVRDDTPEQASDDSDEVIYVVAGEGTLRLGNKDVSLRSSSTAIVPRGTARALKRRGRNPLIVLSVVSGKPCTD